MAARNDVTMSLASFVRAGRSVEDRRTRLRLVAPDSTFLYAEGQTFFVDTPVHTERISMVGMWNVRLEIDAKFFAVLCGKIPTSALSVRLVYDSGRLLINGTGVPVKEVKPKRKK
jgi:hypothetical protein